MQRNLSFITIACLAAGVLCVTPAFAKDKKSPAPEASASPAASASSTDKPARPIPYHGKIASVDATAKTFTIGKRTIKVSDETKITKDGAVATMADIVADEQARGSYWKKADGALEAKTVGLGAKGASSKPMRDAQKKESSEATPTASPK
ncbi:MAG: hypothetical protein ACR2II_09335 [Chthoniobacterales bacterium]